jgi:aminoglycoside phosphotransferase (APT) family kinase protein
MTAGNNFGQAGLAEFLRDGIPGLVGDMRLTRLAGGQSNPTFLADFGGRRVVVRKRPDGPILPSAHAVDREFRVQAALRGSGVPVPEMLLYCSDPNVFGTDFYVMEAVEGRIVHDAALPGCRSAERRAIYRDVATVLARLHAVDWRGVGLDGFGRPENYFARQVARWTKQWRMSRTRELPEIERLIEWLPANIPADERTAIVHGDYRLGNLILHPDRPRVIAVLDWELSTLGHPLADLAHFCLAWHSTPAQYRGLTGLDLAGLDVPTQAEFVADYAQAGGRDVALQPFHIAFALFRFAIIFEGIAARALAGNAAAENAAEIGKLSAPFARRAVALISGGEV